MKDKVNNKNILIWRKSALKIIVIAFIVVFSTILYSQYLSLQKQQSQLLDMKGKLEEKSKIENFDLQEKCAKQAHEVFTLSGEDKTSNSGYSNHYNEKLNKCFVKIDGTNMINGVMWRSETVSDAFEGTQYGSYMWHTEEGKQYSEVSPIICTVKLPSGEEKMCHSQDEFDDLVTKNYMDIKLLP